MEGLRPRPLRRAAGPGATRGDGSTAAALAGGDHQQACEVHKIRARQVAEAGLHVIFARPD